MTSQIFLSLASHAGRRAALTSRVTNGVTKKNFAASVCAKPREGATHDMTAALLRTVSDPECNAKNFDAGIRNVLQIRAREAAPRNLNVSHKNSDANLLFSNPYKSVGNSLKQLDINLMYFQWDAHSFPVSNMASITYVNGGWVYPPPTYCQPAPPEFGPAVSACRPRAHLLAYGVRHSTKQTHDN